MQQSLCEMWGEEEKKNQQQKDAWMRGCQPDAWMTQEEIDEENARLADPGTMRSFEYGWMAWRKETQLGDEGIPSDEEKWTTIASSSNKPLTQ